MLHMLPLIFSLFFSLSNTDCETVPPLNQKVIAFTKKQLGKTVGKGECWDLAAQALDAAGAKWDHDYKFGREVKFGKECVFPGDIIQFEGVEVQYTEGKTIYILDFEHHTAVIHTVKSKDEFLIAEQNTSTHGRKVSVDPLRIKDIKKGKFKIYRPVN